MTTALEIMVYFLFSKGLVPNYARLSSMLTFNFASNEEPPQTFKSERNKKNGGFDIQQQFSGRTGSRRERGTRKEAMGIGQKGQGSMASGSGNGTGQWG